MPYISPNLLNSCRAVARAGVAGRAAQQARQARGVAAVQLAADQLRVLARRPCAARALRGGSRVSCMRWESNATPCRLSKGAEPEHDLQSCTCVRQWSGAFWRSGPGMRAALLTCAASAGRGARRRPGAGRAAPAPGRPPAS